MSNNTARKIVVGADHGGYKLKERIKEMLKKARYSVEDVGTDSDEPCDYPEYGYRAAKRVSLKKVSRGIVVCKTGIGMSMMANKVRGVRAGLCYTRTEAISSRQHNDANVLVLAAAKISTRTALEIVRAWLKTKALKGRHARRVRQIGKLEKKEASV